jgi:Na+-translocating ferredoxin:NAD+ oxidoreductase RnfA subunit
VTFGNYARFVLVSAVFSQAALLPFLPVDVRPAVATGAALAAANVLTAFALVAWGLERSPKALLAAVLGGMAVRTGLVLLAVVLGLTLFGLPRAPLALSLLGYFIPFLALEVAVLHKKTLAPGVAR